MLGSFDPTLLARIQFVFKVSYHFLFPALTSYLVVLNGLWHGTKDRKFLDLFRPWVKLLALAFATGVLSGIVRSFEYRTKWSVFSDKAGTVIGAPITYEVLSAFFLGAGFLCIMLFGRERSGPTLLMVACAAVAFGTFFSAFWILRVNSCMQSPTGFSNDPSRGQSMPENFWEINFNPSFPQAAALRARCRWQHGRGGV